MHDYPRSLALARQQDATDLIEMSLDDLNIALQKFILRAETRAADLGDDAPHWLNAAAEAAQAFLTDHVHGLQCETSGCGRLAVWLHPDCSEKFCRIHADQFVECGICGDTMLTAEAVGEPAGHESCHESHAMADALIYADGDER